MADEPSRFEPQQVWQRQTVEHDPITLAAVHAKAKTFQARIRRRNLIEYAACVVVIVGFAPGMLQRGLWLMQAGCLWMILATLFVAWQLHRRGSAVTPPDGGEAVFDFHRRELIRQRDALRSIGVWYLGPFVPGFVLIDLAGWYRPPPPHRTVEQVHTGILIVTAFTVLVFLGIWLLNQRGAARLQKQIDALG